MYEDYLVEKEEIQEESVNSFRMQIDQFAEMSKEIFDSNNDTKMTISRKKINIIKQILKRFVICKIWVKIMKMFRGGFKTKNRSNFGIYPNLH